jgi:small-conductance mechanosensitive channel
MDRLADWFAVTPVVRDKLLASVAVVTGLWLLRRFVLGWMWRRQTDPAARYHWRKGTLYAAVVVGALVLGRTWITGLRGLSTFLGLLSAGLAIALKDLIANLAGWGFILWRRPFEVGDRVQIGAHAGDVIDLRLFQFTLLEVGDSLDADYTTGRVIHVPNGLVFTTPLVNYSQPFRQIWDELNVLVTFESSWQKAKQLLYDATVRHARHITAEAEREIRDAAGRFLIQHGTLEPALYTAARDSGVLLTARYLVEPRQRRRLRHAIWEDVLARFAAAEDVESAYPTTRFYDAAREARPAPGRTAGS